MVLNYFALLVSAESSLRESDINLKTARELITTLSENVATAKAVVDRNKNLLDTGAVSQTEFDQMTFRYTDLMNQLTNSKNDEQVSLESIEKNKNNVFIAEQNVGRAKLQLAQLKNSELPRVQAEAKKAKLAKDSMVGEEHTLIATAKARLSKAQFDLEQTVVRAPSEGYAIGVTLRPGQRVAAFPVRSWMSFVNEESTRIVMGVEQVTLRYVEPGQPVEVTFKRYPGRIFNATVNEIASVNPTGQLAPSGNIPDAPAAGMAAAPFGVTLKMEEADDLDISALQGGSVGSAAVYTEHSKFAHVIRKVMIRMDAWLNYVMP